VTSKQYEKKTNKAAYGSKKRKCKVSLYDRCKLSKGFYVSDQKLKCKFCGNKVITNDSTAIRKHLRTSTHELWEKDGELVEQKSQPTPLIQPSIVETSRARDIEDQPSGFKTKTDHELEWRILLLATWLKAMIPLNKLSEMTPIIDKYPIPARRVMAGYIPTIYGSEMARVVEEIGDGPFSIIFDGTTKVSEVLLSLRAFGYMEK
jgi:hypothetical protein